MAESFEFRDLAGAEFWGVDLTGAQFRDVDLTDVVMDVGAPRRRRHRRVRRPGRHQRRRRHRHVNEHDPWYPLRALVRPDTPEDVRAAWAALDEVWTAAIERARRLPEADAHESVDGEWSFVETLRHLVFATDKWFTAPILGAAFDPIGLPNTGSVDFPWPGLDPDARPDVRRGRGRARRPVGARARLRRRVTAAELTAPVEVLENGAHTVLECLSTVFEEEFAHLRYALRDLDRLEADR